MLINFHTMRRRYGMILLGILTSFILISCSDVTQIEQELVPTPTPLWGYGQTRNESTDRFVDQANALCMQAFETSTLKPGVDRNYLSALVLRHVAFEADTKQGLRDFLPLAEDSSPFLPAELDQTDVIVCVKQDREAIAEYSAGGIGAARTAIYEDNWSIRVLQWPDGTILAKDYFQEDFGVPPSSITVRKRDNYRPPDADDLPDEFWSWLSSKVDKDLLLPKGYPRSSPGGFQSYQDDEFRRVRFMSDGNSLAHASRINNLIVWDVGSRTSYHVEDPIKSQNVLYPKDWEVPVASEFVMQHIAFLPDSTSLLGLDSTNFEDGSTGYDLVHWDRNKHEISLVYRMRFDFIEEGRTDIVEYSDIIHIANSINSSLAAIVSRDTTTKYPQGQSIVNDRKVLEDRYIVRVLDYVSGELYSEFDITPSMSFLQRVVQRRKQQDLVSVAFDPSFDSFVAVFCHRERGMGGVCEESEIHLWDLKLAKLEWISEPFDGHIRSIAFSSKDGLLAIAIHSNATWDGFAPSTLALVDTESKQVSKITNELGLLVFSVAYSPDGRMIAVGGCLDFDRSTSSCRIGEAQLWNIENQLLINTWSGFRGAVDGLSFSPTDPILAIRSEDDVILLANVSE
ncbi:MAG: hypothetical protein KDE46_00085 [Caldilineaceae bacterium]|nr:hypothetical protein [Caldilineaceae bacterium]